MRLLHSLARTCASFDDPNLVSHAGLVPVMALAQHPGWANWSRSSLRSAGMPAARLADSPRMRRSPPEQGSSPPLSAVMTASQSTAVKPQVNYGSCSS